MRRVRRRPAYVGNCAFQNDRMEIRSNLSRICHRPGRMPILPQSRGEALFCVALAAAGAALMFGIPAIMSLLRIGGVW